MEEKEKHIIQEDWTLRLRERLNDYEEPAPEGLWESIAESIPQQQSDSIRMVFTPWMRRAAAILLLIITGAACWYAVNDIDNGNAIVETYRPAYTGTTDIDAVNNAPDNFMTDNGTTVSQSDKPLLADAGISIKEEYNAKEHYTEDKQEQYGNTTDNGQQKEALESYQNNTDKRNNIYDRENNSGKKSGNIQHNRQNTGYMPEKYRHAAHAGKVTAGLYAANTMANGRLSTNGVLMSANVINMNSNNGSYYEDKRVSHAQMFLANYKEETKHSLPISAGLSVSYGITDRLWIETGAVYTRLSSDFTRFMNNDVVTENQTLHYVGIPLNAGYTVYRRHNISIYGIAGGEADINVKSRREIEGIKTDADKDRVQWSVKAAAGAQYNILPQLGIYVEPGIKYYPDNGSKIDNIFKDKKLNFNLQLGVRYDINR